MKRTFFLFGLFFALSAAADSCDQSGTMCIMLYAPAVCTAATYDGYELDPPFVAKGSNPCFAMQDLRKQLCEAGLDPDGLSEDDVTCTQTASVCPVPECAAPPQGCTYRPNGAKGENGCPVGCGDLFCPDPR